ncbi:MAG: hypothetical protein ACPGYP_04625 [Solirubrobacterales bacterium]
MANASSKRKTNTAAPFNVAWIVFFVLLIFSPDTLTDIWEWVQDLALVWELLIWLFTFPYMLALAVWESGWADWQRIALVVAIALLWTGIFNGSAAQSRNRSGK